ncbi:MAG: terminase gpA endonuclease subunit [Candidatus Omnitrophota bacterium]
MILQAERLPTLRKRQNKINWTAAELRAWQLPKKINVSQWADENRILDSRTSSEPGRWRTERTPYLQGIMDAFTDPLIESITIKASTQVGKTETILNMLGYTIDQDPAPTLFVGPRKDDAKMISSDRIKPMIELSQALSNHLTDYDDDVTQFVVNLDKMILYLAWANSPAALSSKPIRYLFLDEVNKYPPFSGKEADPIKLATERTRTFWNRKIVKVSTPTTEDGYISREYEQSDKSKFYVPCPHCGKYQIMTWAQVKFPPEERNPEIIKLKRLAWYECEECRGVITDTMKQKIMLKGKWLPEGCSIDKEGNTKGNLNSSSHRGFWINALYSPWLTFAEIVAEWLDSQDRPELLMNFINSWLAEEWKEKIEERKPEMLKKLALEYEAGKVPEGAIVLVAGVDVQKDHFIYTIRGFGVGYENWLIKAAYVETWEEIIAQIINGFFPSEIKGLPDFQVSLANIDTGHRTDEVYQMCREFGGILRPIKGSDNLRGLLYKLSTIDKYPNGRVIPGGLKLYHIDTNMFKDKLARLINIEGENKKWHLHREPSETYLKQMCSEGKILERGKNPRQRREVWKTLSLHTPNHFWDAEVYALAAAEMLRVYALRAEDKPKLIIEAERPENVEKEKWIRPKGNWLRRG